MDYLIYFISLFVGFTLLDYINYLYRLYTPALSSGRFRKSINWRKVDWLTPSGLKRYS